MSALLVVGLALAPAASAAPSTSTSPRRGTYIRIDPGPPDPVSLAAPAILYLDDCKPTGCLLRPGPEDARLDQSSIISGPRTLAPYAGSDAAWAAIVACVRQNFSPFLIEVVTTDPGNVPHYRAVAAGLPGDLGFPTGVGGVAPFSCGVIPNATTFSFLNLEPENVLSACWTISQEAAHAFGLEHSMLATDAMTYIPNPPHKTFVDELACIGTAGCCQGSCDCGRTEINSHQRLLAVLGAAPGPPDVTIARPLAREVVPAGFAIEVESRDAETVAKIEILIDTVLVATLTAPPYTYTTATDLEIGIHSIVARAVNKFGATSSTSIEVARGTLRPDAGPDAGPGEGGGCTTGGAAGAGAGLLIGIAVLLGRRRRRAAITT